MTAALRQRIVGRFTAAPVTAVYPLPSVVPYGEVIGVGVPNAMNADTFHDPAVTAPVQRCGVERVRTRVVYAARSSRAHVGGVHFQHAPIVQCDDVNHARHSNRREGV